MPISFQKNSHKRPFYPAAGSIGSYTQSMGAFEQFLFQMFFPYATLFSFCTCPLKIHLFILAFDIFLNLEEFCPPTVCAHKSDQVFQW